MKRFFELVIVIGLVSSLSSCGHSIADKQDFIRHANALPDVVCVEENCSEDQLALIEEAKAANNKNFIDRPGTIFVYPEAYVTTGYNRVGPVICLRGGPEYRDQNGEAITEKSKNYRALHLPEKPRSADPDYEGGNHFFLTFENRLWDNNCAPNEEIREEARALKAELEAQEITVE